MNKEIKKLITKHIINQEMNLDESVEYIWEVCKEEESK